VDVKRLGLSAVVFLARCYGLEVGSRARGTLARLEAAARAGLMGEDAWVTVGQAYRFLLGLRLRHQLRAVADGRPPSDELDLAGLTAIERTRLKDAFRAIKRWQEKAAYHYQVALL
jgi:CBS domain-containing protein